MVGAKKSPVKTGLDGEKGGQGKPCPFCLLAAEFADITTVGSENIHQ